MREAIYNGARNILIGELETPKAGEHDIAVKNLYDGICGTDVAVYSHGPGTGNRITLGGESGHEVVSGGVEGQKLFLIFTGSLFLDICGNFCTKGGRFFRV